jgi:hypothetical protein
MVVFIPRWTVMILICALLIYVLLMLDVTPNRLIVTMVICVPWIIVNQKPVVYILNKNVLMRINVPKISVIQALDVILPPIVVVIMMLVQKIVVTLLSVA